MAKVLQMYEYSKGKSLPVGGKSLLLQQKRFSTAVKWHFSRSKRGVYYDQDYQYGHLLCRSDKSDALASFFNFFNLKRIVCAQNNLKS